MLSKRRAVIGSNVWKQFQTFLTSKEVVNHWLLPPGRSLSSDRSTPGSFPNGHRSGSDIYRTKHNRWICFMSKFGAHIIRARRTTKCLYSDVTAWPIKQTSLTLAPLSLPISVIFKLVSDIIGREVQTNVTSKSTSTTSRFHLKKSHFSATVVGNNTLSERNEWTAFQCNGKRA